MGSRDVQKTEQQITKAGIIYPKFFNTKCARSEIGVWVERIGKEFIGYRGEQISLYLQDCVQGMKEKLEPGSVDIVVTSPPYNIGIQYNRYKDKMPKASYLDWIRTVAAHHRFWAKGRSMLMQMISTPGIFEAS